MLQLGNLLNMV